MNPWYWLSWAGAPEVWAVIGALLVLAYFLLRAAYPKVPRQWLKGFLIIFIPALLLTFGAIQALKMGLQTPRPCTPCLDLAEGCNPYCPPDPAFPSGHAGTIFVLFTSVFIITRHKWGWLALLVLAVLVSVSRVALGVHTWADVLTGAVLGILVVVLIWKLEKYLKLGQIVPKTS